MQWSAEDAAQISRSVLRDLVDISKVGRDMRVSDVLARVLPLSVIARVDVLLSNVKRSEGFGDALNSAHSVADRLSAGNERSQDVEAVVAVVKEFQDAVQ